MKFPEGSPIHAHSNSAYGMEVCQCGAHLITCAKYAYYEELLSTKNSWSAKYGLNGPIIQMLIRKKLKEGVDLTSHQFPKWSIESVGVTFRCKLGFFLIPV